VTISKADIHHALAAKYPAAAGLYSMNCRIRDLGDAIRFHDGRGRVFDSIFVERLWRTVKCEEVYLKDYQTVGEAMLNLRRYFAFYNLERPHQSLDYRTPAEVYGACPAVEAGDAAWPAAGTPVALRAPSVPAASAW